MMVEPRAAGRKRPIINEVRVGRGLFIGGSETRPTWKKSIGKTETKKIRGEALQRERITVKAMVMASKGHRKSLTHFADNPDRKLYDFGNVVSNPMLWMPLRLDAAKLLCSPARDTTPQPPS